MSYWRSKKVLVTGGAGFVGSHVVEELLRRGAKVTVAGTFAAPAWKRNLKDVLKHVRLVKADLRGAPGCLKACAGQQAVLNLAGRVGGVGYNSTHSGSLFRDNILISTNMIEAARVKKIERYLVTSSACVYPRDCRIPTPETEGFRDAPEVTNEGYGWAKRMAEYLGQKYADQFGLSVAIARPYNAYGPRDHFDSPDAHAIAALIRRVVKGESPLVVWGDGSPSRSFIYVEDVARGLVDAAEKCSKADPVNLGNDEETTIKRLAETILRVAGSTARLVFDKKKPMGQPRRRCDVAKARKTLNFQARVPLEEGLRRSIEWYRANKGKAK